MTSPARIADHYDSELSRLHRRLMAAAAISSTDQVLDVGCGAGLTTRDAARAASSGSVLGVDLSAPMLARARAITVEEGLDNVTYELGDAQVHRFRADHVDVVISRFGTMFFRDPAAAFSNIAGAMRRGGRLVMMVWQHARLNEWVTAIRTALLDGREDPGPSPGALDPFSLADPVAVDALLRAAGFTDVAFTDVQESVHYGPDRATAYDLVRDLQMSAALLDGLDAAATERALARLRDTLAAHETADGVWFGSRAWIVTARRGGW